MSNKDLTHKIAELMSQMATMQSKIDSLMAQVQPTLPVPLTQQSSIIPNTTRRKMLRRFASGMLAGLAIGTVGAALPERADAKLIARTGRVGAVITPDGDAAINNPIPNVKYGLVALSGTGPNYDLSTFGNSNIYDSFVNNAAVFARSSNTGVYGGGVVFGVFGSGTTGVYGAGTPNAVGTIGVFGTSTGTGVQGTADTIGVSGYSFTGIGIRAESSNGAPLRIAPNNPPSTGTREKGDIYVDLSGNLHIYNGTEWRLVQTVAG